MRGSTYLGMSLVGSRTIVNWDVPEISQEDAKAAVKAAYLALAKQWHPDRCDDLGNAELQMKLLNKAYQEFKDES